MRARFPIGLQFVYHGDRFKKINTIVDILTTTNSKGEVRMIEYVTEHPFCGGVVSQTFGDTAIARSLGNEGIKPYL